MVQNVVVVGVVAVVRVRHIVQNTTIQVGQCSSMTQYGKELGSRQTTLATGRLAARA